MDFSKISDILVEIMYYVFNFLTELGLEIPDYIVSGINPRA